MSQDNVRKYVRELEERQSISKENATVVTKNKSKRNDNLLYTIRLIDPVGARTVL